MNSENHILIADSHIREDSADGFFAMLDRIREYRPAGVVFLGDIFELWIALDGYESGIHRRFLEWCAESKKVFEVGFILGNHEFYLMDRHAGAFSWISEVGHTTPDGIRFIHGDLINRADFRYLTLRKLLRNRFTRRLLKITAGTIGPRVSEKVRTSLKSTNLQNKRILPESYLARYAQTARAAGIRHIFAGHFHRHVQLDLPDGVPVEILPAWGNAGEIVLLTPGGETSCGPWRELLAQPATNT